MMHSICTARSGGAVSIATISQYSRVVDKGVSTVATMSATSSGTISAITDNYRERVSGGGVTRFTSKFTSATTITTLTSISSVTTSASSPNLGIVNRGNASR
jgi:hypothetical protein